MSGVISCVLLVFAQPPAAQRLFCETEEDCIGVAGIADVFETISSVIFEGFRSMVITEQGCNIKSWREA